MGDQEIEIAESKFENLHEDLQDKFTDCYLDIIKIEEYTDDELEEMFFRLNNGTALTITQKARAKAGYKIAEFIDEMLNTDFFKKKTYFTKSQLKKSQDQTVIMQAIMLLSGKPYNSFAEKDVLQFVDTQEITDDAMEKVREAINYLDEALPLGTKIKDGKIIEEPDKFIKKVNLPMLILQATKAIKEGYPPKQFGGWIQILASDYKPGMGYGQYCGAGSVKLEKVNGRIREMNNHFQENIQKATEYKPKEVKGRGRKKKSAA